MRLLQCSIFVACATLSVSAYGQPAKPPGQLESVRADYRKVLEKIQVSNDAAVKLAAEDYKRQLVLLLDAETKAGRLDAALLVRDEIANIDASTGPNTKLATKAALKKALGGTKWKWDESPLILQSDGLAKHPGWDASKIVTKWEVVDRRTVILIIEKGRNINRYAILEFSESLDEFKGFDFEQGRLEVKKRLPGSIKDK